MDILGKDRLRADEKEQVRAVRSRFLAAFIRTRREAQMKFNISAGRFAQLIGWSTASVNKMMNKDRLPIHSGREMITQACAACILLYSQKVEEAEAELAELRKGQREWVELSVDCAHTPHLTNYKRVPKKAPPEPVRGALSNWSAKDRAN